MSIIVELNELAKRIPRAAFKAAGLPLDCVTYVYLYEGDVIYVGEGEPSRAPKHLTTRGLNSPDFDLFIDMFWDDPELDVYLAASKINKAVAREFENILIKEFDPPFNEDKSLRHYPYSPTDRDTFRKMKSAEKLDINCYRRPWDHRAGKQVWHWKQQKQQPFPLDASLELIPESGNPWRPNTRGWNFYTTVLAKLPANAKVSDAIALGAKAGFSAVAVQRNLQWLYAWHGGRYLKIAGKRFAPPE